MLKILLKYLNYLAVVAINEFPTDTEAEINLVKTWCRITVTMLHIANVWAKGGEGGVELANEVVRIN